MFYKFHSQDPWLKSVLGPFWAFQLFFLLALVSSYVWVIPYAGLQSTSIAVLVISGICIVLVVTEIILFTAARLHPLAYLILQLGKTITWVVFFTLAAIHTARDYSWSTSPLEYGLITENVVLLLTFLAALIYASIVYHRYRLAKTHFLHSVLGPDLFPVRPAYDVGHAAPSNPTTRTPLSLPPASLEATFHPATATPKTKEAIEVTVLRELGGGEWNVYELPATRSVRNSRGGTRRGTMEGGSERSLKVA